jgi:cytochrome c oxidase subunit III
MDKDAAVPVVGFQPGDQLPTGNYSGPVGLTPGRLGIWTLIASEIVLFAGLFGSFILMRLVNSAWSEEARHLSLLLGTLNSLVLLTSNFFMMKSSKSVAEDRAEDARKFMALTMLMGVVFLGIKAVEYSREFAHGEFPTTGGFWSFYFLMTGVHALHILGGLVAILMLWSKTHHEPLASLNSRATITGIYWSFVEVVWIFLFPMLYLLA